MSRKASVRSNKVCFTLNNYTEEECQALQRSLQDLSAKSNLAFAIVGKEIAPSGTPHLQGYIRLLPKFLKAKDGIVSKWRSLIPSLARAHMESAHGTDLDSKTYCSKDGDVLIELGSSETQTPAQKLVDLTSMAAVKESNPDMYIRNYFQLKKITLGNFLASTTPTPMTMLRWWQLEVMKLVYTQTRRQILYVHDSVGNVGKSQLATHYDAILGDKVYIVQGGRSVDNAYALMQHICEKTEFPELVIFDYPRQVKPEFYAWSFIEQLKNGRLTSTKYESACLRLPNPPAILVFSNYGPPEGNDVFSADRWVTYDLDSQLSIIGRQIHHLHPASQFDDFKAQLMIQRAIDEINQFDPIEFQNEFLNEMV